MTEREFALYEALKILMCQMAEAGVIDYTTLRRRLEIRQKIFREHGMTNAAAILGTLATAAEPPGDIKNALLPLQPLDDLTFVQN